MYTCVGIYVFMYIYSYSHSCKSYCECHFFYFNILIHSHFNKNFERASSQRFYNISVYGCTTVYLKHIAYHWDYSVNNLLLKEMLRLKKKKKKVWWKIDVILGLANQSLSLLSPDFPRNKEQIVKLGHWPLPPSQEAGCYDGIAEPGNAEPRLCALMYR